MRKRIISRFNLGRMYSRYILSIKYGLKLNKPRLLLQILSNYFRIPFGYLPLRTIDFAPTYQCNFQCKHCFASFLEDHSKTPLTIANYKNIADDAANLGAVHIAFQGGEPLILKDLGDLIEAIDPSRFIVSITTNGYLLTKEKMIEFKNRGVDMLTISIDSGIPEEHDTFRGTKGAFERAVNAIKLAMENGIGVCINTLVSHETIYSDGLKEIIALCDRLGIKLTLILPAMAGKWREAFTMRLDKKDYCYLNQLLKRFPFIRRDLDANYLYWGCGAVKEMLYINLYGDVFPCSFIHCCLGNIKEERLSKIRERGLKIEEFKHYHHNCLAAEDMNFIERRMCATIGREKLPIEFSEMFPEVHLDAILNNP